MSNQNEFRLHIDTSDLTNKVNELEKITVRNLISDFKKSLSKASIQTVVKEARRDLRNYLAYSDDSTGATAKALGVKTARRKPLVLLGGRNTGRYNGSLTHILDSGTDERYTKSGSYRGRVLGLNFFLNAFEAKESDLKAEFEMNLKKNYLKRIEKINK